MARAGTNHRMRHCRRYLVGHDARAGLQGGWRFHSLFLRGLIAMNDNKPAVLAVMDRLCMLATDKGAGGHEAREARAAVAELIERLEASNWRLANVLALIPADRPERAQIEQEMADNRAALARVGRS